MLNKVKQKRNGQLFVISGPSGSGKTTLVKKILADRKLKKKLVKSISLTTRPKRSKERSGADYLFISEKQFRQRQKAKKILEWTRYLGYYYATPRDCVEENLRQGKHILLCLDLAGVLKIKRFYPRNTTTIFILPPSLSELCKRIRKRCQKTTAEEIEKRLSLARKEIQEAAKFDFSLVNRDLAQVTRDLKQIILDKTKN